MHKKPPISIKNYFSLNNYRQSSKKVIILAGKTITTERKTIKRRRKTVSIQGEIKIHQREIIFLSPTGDNEIKSVKKEL